MLEQVRNDSRLAPSSLLLGKARERSLLSLNRKVVNSELFPSPPHSFERLLFAPAAGYRYSATGALSVIGARGYYWSSSSYAAGNLNAGDMDFTDVRVVPLGYPSRASALSVRCVQASALKLLLLEIVVVAAVRSWRMEDLSLAIIFPFVDFFLSLSSRAARRGNVERFD